MQWVPPREAETITAGLFGGRSLPDPYISKGARSQRYLVTSRPFLIRGLVRQVLVIGARKLHKSNLSGGGKQI